MVPSIVIVIILFIGLLIFLGVSLYPFSEKYCGCHDTIPNYFFLLFGVLLILAVIPISYYFSSKKTGEKLDKHLEALTKFADKTTAVEKNGGNVNKQSILKFLGDYERKVLERLLESKGSVLQSEISRIEGMTKLKAHRAVKNLEQKEIIKIERHGKTNRIFLAKDIKNLLDA